MRHFWGNLSSSVAGVRAHHQVVEQLAAQLNLPLARVAEAIPHDIEHFGDICHLTDAGNEILGRIVAAAIRAAYDQDAKSTQDLRELRVEAKSQGSHSP